jgi:hypothetical protein
VLVALEKFFRQCEQQGKRALLVVDEAQNLSPQTVEELRMLSNFQGDNKSLLQTFLLGQPEFRKTLLGNDMQQLRQRITATYHLGPMDRAETKSYIEHRLKTVGWGGNPGFDEEAFDAIHQYTGGIPRRINALCDRLLLMGYLEKLQHFGVSEVNEVIRDIQQEFDAVEVEAGLLSGDKTSPLKEEQFAIGLEEMSNRVAKLEETVVSLMGLLKQILSLADVNKRLR